MGALRGQAFRMLHSLSYLRTLAMQSTKEPVLSSSIINGRAIVGCGIHTPSVVSKSISFQWGILNSNGTSSFSTSSSSEGINYNSETSSNPGRKKRPPADLSPLFPGRDDEHWLIIMHFPEGEPSKEEMIGRYVKTLATVLGSEEEATKAIYSVSFDRFKYFGFGCEISKEQSEKLKGLPGVFMIFQDSYVDPTNKDYGGELFVDGKIVQRPPERQRLVDRTGQHDQSNESSRHRARSRVQSREDMGIGPIGPLGLSLSSEVED